MHSGYIMFCNRTNEDSLIFADWVPIVFAYAQSHWGVDLSLDWTNCNTCENNDRRAMIDTFWKAWEVRLNELCADVVACPGALELVEGLRAVNIPMAIATSSRLDSVREKMLK